MTADAIGGVWPYALELTDALAPHGVEVALAVMGGAPQPEQLTEVERSHVARVHTADFALEWMEDPWPDVEAAGEWLLEMAEDERPDLVHLNGYAHASLAWEAPVVVVGHSCVLSWFAAVTGEPAPPRYRRYAEVVSRGLAAADFLVAPTQAMLAELERLYAPSCVRRAIPNGRRPLAEAAAKEPFVLAAGRLWDQAKNVAALDRVAPGLAWPVLLVGYADLANPPRNARALGYLEAPELASLLARASIYAAPARYEPFGLGPLEAGLAGCALVLGDIPSLREVWGDAAVFVDPADDEALEHALALLIGDESRRRDLAARARKRARRYTPERMASAYMEVYERLSNVRSTQAVA